MSASDHLNRVQFSREERPDALYTGYKSHHFHATAEGHLVGYAVTSEPPDSDDPVDVSRVYVTPKERGQGLGHELMDRVTAHHTGRDMTLSAEPFEDEGGTNGLEVGALMDFYGSHGFKADRGLGTGMRRERR